MNDISITVIRGPCLMTLLLALTPILTSICDLFSALDCLLTYRPLTKGCHDSHIPELVWPVTPQVDRVT